MNNPFSFEVFRMILDNDDTFPVDETLFYFDDEPENEREHYLGCLREYKTPYWIGYCDIKGGSEFYTASELLNAKVFNGKSIKDRWEHLIIEHIGGIPLESWLEFYGHKI